MSNDAEPTMSRLFYGHTMHMRIEDGATIEFGEREPPTPFCEGWAFCVEFPNNTRNTLFAEPEHGSTAVGWKYQPALGGPLQDWIFNLDRLKDGVWRIRFEEQHTFIQAEDDARLTRG